MTKPKIPQYGCPLCLKRLPVVAFVKHLKAHEMAELVTWPSGLSHLLHNLHLYVWDEPADGSPHPLSPRDRLTALAILKELQVRKAAYHRANGHNRPVRQSRPRRRHTIADIRHLRSRQPKRPSQ